MEKREAARRFVQVLQLHVDFPAEEIAAALKRALEVECFHPDGIRNLLLVQHDLPTVPVRLDLSTRADLPQPQVTPPELGQYNQLLGQEG